MAAPLGKMLVIEGLEGAGKSTAMNTVADLLYQFNLPIVTTREPGGTAIGEALRTIIKDPAYKNVMDNRSELLLLYSSRVQLLEEVIRPALKKGTWVLADRFELSTFAYQGGGRGIDAKLLQDLSQFCLGGFKPDLTLYLDISPELGMQRAKQRGQFDRIEQQSIDFFHKVHQGYMSRIKDEPHIEMIDASRPLNEVQEAIKKTVTSFIEKQRL